MNAVRPTPQTKAEAGTARAAPDANTLLCSALSYPRLGSFSSVKASQLIPVGRGSGATGVRTTRTTNTTAFRRIRVAAVGLGWVCLHRHLPAMEQSGRYKVVGVIDHQAGRAKAVAEKRGYHRHAAAERLADVPWLHEVDAVTIATAPMAHADLIDQALALGKHVLTEKPFTLTLSEGHKLVESAAQRQLCLGVVHNFQFARSMKRLVADVERGKLGHVLSINAVQLSNPRRRLPTWYDDLPLGLFYDESPHFLYLLRRLVGDIELIRSIATPDRAGGNTPGQLDAYFRCSTGAAVTLRCNFQSPISEWHIMVFGENGLGIVDVFRDIYVMVPNDRSHGTFRVLRTSMAATAQHWWQHIISGIPHITGRLLYGNDEVFARFATAVNGSTEALSPIGPKSALAVLELQHQIIRAVTGGLAHD